MLIEKMPNITLNDLQGNPISTHDYHGKKTLIFMWSSW
jgi:peroxiredoxin